MLLNTENLCRLEDKFEYQLTLTMNDIKSCLITLVKNGLQVTPMSHPANYKIYRRHHQILILYLCGRVAYLMLV